MTQASEIKVQARPQRMGRGPGSIMMGEKAKDFKGTTKRFLKFVRWTAGKWPASCGICGALRPCCHS